MRLTVPLALGAIAAITGSVSACPTGADLAKGIRFDAASGNWEVFRAKGDSVVEARYHLSAVSWHNNLLAKGLYLLEDGFYDKGKLDPASTITYSFAMPPAEMPDPIPGSTWSTQATTKTAEGPSAEAQVYEFGEFTRLQIGACSYQMMPITIRYPVHEQDGISTSLIYWLPELGLSYLAASTFDGKTDRFDYIAVSAVE